VQECAAGIAPFETEHAIGTASPEMGVLVIDDGEGPAEAFHQRAEPLWILMSRIAGPRSVLTLPPPRIPARSAPSLKSLANTNSRATATNKRCQTPDQQSA
jgi:hypothetical protein